MPVLWLDKAVAVTAAARSAEARGGALTRVAIGSSAEMVARLLAVLLPDAETVLDATYGNGQFWSLRHPVPVAVTGLDRDPSRARDVCGDFTRLPFRDGAFSVAIFDPPYLTDAGRESVVRQRFGSFATVADLEHAVRLGTAEAWRVSRVGLIVKVMDYIHASRLVRMTRWVEESVPADLYDLAHLTSSSKVEDGKWSRIGGQLSVRSNATTFLVFRRDGAIHRRRSGRQGSEGR